MKGFWFLIQFFSNFVVPPWFCFFSHTKIFSFLIRVGLGVNVSKIANCDWNFSASFKYFLHLYNTKIFTEERGEETDVFYFAISISEGGRREVVWTNWLWLNLCSLCGHQLINSTRDVSRIFITWQSDYFMSIYSYCPATFETNVILMMKKYSS